MNHRERLYNALKSECEARINEALLTLDMCFLKGTAIGEHTSEHFLEESPVFVATSVAAAKAKHTGVAEPQPAAES